MKKTYKKAGFWIPIDIWNLNELFTTESISPISFYIKRNFGNPLNRNNQIIEDENNLILFDSPIQNNILLNISEDLIDINFLNEIKSNGKIKSYEYTKTIYFRKNLIKVIFSTTDLLNQFLNSSFMLLEVKTINKYKTEFIVDKSIKDLRAKAFYQTNLTSDKNNLGPFYDKAFNQIKGLIYGYLIGKISSLDEKEQNLLNELTKLKNSIAGIHTDIMLAGEYSNFWLINIRNAIKVCSNLYLKNFGKEIDIFSTLTLRLQEIDNLNKFRFEELERQNSLYYKQEFEKTQYELEKAKNALHKFEIENKITWLYEQLEAIKNQEENIGKLKGKKREYFKKGTEEYSYKIELKRHLQTIDQDYNYKELRQSVKKHEDLIRTFQFGYTIYDSSITEQFNRISENLNETAKKAKSDFISLNNQSTILPEISFKISINDLVDFYSKTKDNFDFEKVLLPEELKSKFTQSEIEFISIASSVILKYPQGLLGSHSEQNIMDIIISIGNQLKEGMEKKTLREYYFYRMGKSENFVFPDNTVLSNLLVFLMKSNGHDQINKQIINKNILHKEIALLFYGAYVGFGNMPKTFTNTIFDSDNFDLINYVDNYLFN